LILFESIDKHPDVLFNNNIFDIFDDCCCDRSTVMVVFDNLIHSVDMIVEELKMIFEFEMVIDENVVISSDVRFKLLPSILKFPWIIYSVNVVEYKREKFWL